uniref:Aminotransferase class I/classII large domain-containing protein n=1 Tax=Pygocentrus nattereri TaxID=42514 RepID=A0AAR2KFJ7_PYGNA
MFTICIECSLFELLHETVRHISTGSSSSQILDNCVGTESCILHDLQEMVAVYGVLHMALTLCFLLQLTQPDMLLMEPSLLQYPDWKGHCFLREEVAKFLSEHCRSPVPLKAENMVVMNGCGSIFCAVAAVLCDPDGKNAILIPSPFYGVITEDVDLYSGVKLYCVPLDSEVSESDARPFHLSAEKLEHALERAKKEGVNVRAVILVNPHNPLGEIYTAEEMTSFLNFAKRHELHAIVDEVYMLSVFGEDFSFHSVLSLERIPDAQRTHVLWGLSKDFAMAGVRVGTVYSENRDLVQALDKLGNFHGVAGPLQRQVAQLLKDKEWLNEVFLPENRRRLKKAHQYVAAQLTKLGIPYLHRGAGFFIWADFSKYLKEQTFVEELCLWRCFVKHRVLLSCSQAFSCSSPGWFRIVFTDQQRHLQLGLFTICLVYTCILINCFLSQVINNTSKYCKFLFQFYFSCGTMKNCTSTLF